MILTDTDLHAYLLSRRVGETVGAVHDLLASVMAPGVRANAAGLLRERAREHGSDAWEEVVLDAFAVCPHNLAERFVESALLYRLVGSVLLPELLPLALVLLRTDLKAYFSPQSRPYRDHLAHQTRVASLAHLLLSGHLPLPPWQRFVDDRLAGWPATTEHALLVRHLTRLGLEDALPLGDASRSLVLSAALLAGLVHDLGYALRYESVHGDGADAALRRLGIFPDGRPGADDPPRAPVTALYRTFFGDTGPGSPFASMRRYVSAHPTSPHSLAGAMWLAYLPERLHREGILGTPGGVAGRRAHGRFELVCQLAAMMALAHDFPVDSARKQGEQGFSLAGLAGRSLLDCYPCCTLFTLADVLHEFGRPFLRTGPDAVRVRAPVLGIQLRRRDEWYDTDYIPGGTPTQRGEANGRCAKRGLLTDDDLEAARTAPRIEVFWVTEDPQGHFLDPDDGTATPHSTFDPAKVGNDVPARLHGWGLSSVLCQRDVEAARRLDRDPPFKPPRVTAPDGLAMAPSPPPRPGMLAVFPLAEYRDAERGPRDLLGLGTLQ